MRTHAHARTYACVRACTCMRFYMYMCACACMRARAHMHVCDVPCVHACVRSSKSILHKRLACRGWAGCRSDVPFTASLINICKAVNEWLGPEQRQTRPPQSLSVVCPAACPSDCMASCSMAQSKADGSRMPGSDPVADAEYHSRSAVRIGCPVQIPRHRSIHIPRHTSARIPKHISTVQTRAHMSIAVEMSTRMSSVRRATSSATQSSRTLLAPAQGTSACSLLCGESVDYNNIT